MSTVAAMENFRENAMRVMECREISQRELARRVGLHYVSVHRILHGQCDPSLRTCERIAEELGVPFRDLLIEPEIFSAIDLTRVS